MEVGRDGIKIWVEVWVGWDFSVPRVKLEMDEKVAAGAGCAGADACAWWCFL